MSNEEQTFDDVDPEVLQAATDGYTELHKSLSEVGKKLNTGFRACKLFKASHPATQLGNAIDACMQTATEVSDAVDAIVKERDELKTQNGDLTKMVKYAQDKVVNLAAGNVPHAECKGTGKQGDKPCAKCAGAGWVRG